MYKVFVNNVPVILNDTEIKDPENRNIPVYHFENNGQLLNLLGNLNEKGMVIIHDDIKVLWDTFRKNFKEIKAAGGVVKNKDGKILFIFRNGKWDLPKGKVDSGEEIEEAAVREVEEECGIGELEIIKMLPGTYHIYEHKGQQILKTTFWFEMKTDWDKELIPQKKEGIIQAEWFGIDDLDKVRANTYRSIWEFLQDVLF